MTETLAELSNNAMYSATVVYVLAMLAHVAEWAMARTLPADTAAAGGRSALVSAGHTTASLDADASTEPGGASTATTPGPSASPADVERSDKFGRIGLSLTVLALLLHGVGVVSRGVAAERVPWGSMYEFSITSTLAVAAAYVFLVRRYKIRWLGLLVTGFLVIVLGLAMMVLYRPVAPVVPALHSYWLAIHVSAAAIAGGALTVGALSSVLYLVRSSMEAKALASPATPRTGFLWRTPSAVDIDRLSYRVHAFAFPLWTFAVLAGAIWAEYAWGRYWGWDPKEVWAFITWVVYAAYLHARATAGWQGRAAAYVALLGYATFIFNFVGINLFGSGLHAYSGM
ncbi:MAG: c-type cytochrome biogenesis protein CcsB [Nocardioidaceae bacterium]